LCAFSVYRQAVPVEAALIVLTGVTKEQALVTLGSLLEQHLVQVLPATGHYLLHPIVASYASRHFALNGAADDETARKTAHAQDAQYYLQVATANNATAGGVKGISDAQPLIEAVWQLCQAEQFQEAYELMQQEDLFGKLKLWGANAALLELCQLLLSGNWAYTPQQKAFLSGYVGSISNVLGRKQEALRYHEQALRIRREIGDRRQEGVVLNNLGNVYVDLGQKQEALKFYDQALRIKKEVGDRRGEAITLFNIGTACFDLGRNDAALACFLQAKHIFEQVQSPSEGAVGQWIASLRKRVGEEQFEALRAQVEREGPEQIVEQALREMVNEQG